MGDLVVWGLYLKRHENGLHVLCSSILFFLTAKIRKERARRRKGKKSNSFPFMAHTADSGIVSEMAGEYKGRVCEGVGD